MRLTLPKMTGRVVAVDTETSGLYVDEGHRVTTVSAAWRNDNGKLISHAWPFDHGTNCKPGQLDMYEAAVNLQEEEWRRLMTWLGHQRLVFHKAYFDVVMLHAGHREYGAGVDFNGATYWDTKLAAWILAPQESTSLKPTAARLWGESEADEQAALQPFLKKNGYRFDLVPWEVLAPYAAKDAELTYRLWEYQQSLFDEMPPDLWEFFQSELEVNQCLVNMAYRGIGYDVAQSRIEASKARKLLNQVDQALPFHPPTPNQARKWFFDVCKALPHCFTSTNKGSVGECCVRSLIAQQVPGAQEWAIHTKTIHALGKYYDGYADATGPDGRLRTDYHQIGTVTGRFASKRVNLQAIPQDYKLDLIQGVATVRSLFRAKPDHSLWEFDLAQAEARVAAKIAKCDVWLEMFDAGRDLHTETADRLFDAHDTEHRQIAKRANFALIYGVGPATFQIDVEKQIGLKLLDAEAKEIVNGWNKLYPQFKRINKRAEAVAIRRGYVRLVNGRQHWFLPHDELHKAFNAVVQGSIAEFVKRWMVTVDTTLADVLLQVHDSVVCEIEHEHQGNVVYEIMRGGGASATQFFGVPMEVESKLWLTLDELANTVVA